MTPLAANPFESVLRAIALGVPGLAVEADLAGRLGEPGLHVAIHPMPVPFAAKVDRLENPNIPRAQRA